LRIITFIQVATVLEKNHNGVKIVINDVSKSVEHSKDKMEQ